MKKLIYLKVGDPNPQDKKLKKNDLYILEEMARLLSINEFKKQAKDLDLKILKEYPTEASVLIEYADAKDEAAYSMYDALRAIPIVEIIDSILPKD
jgi:hypothetical protein